MKLASGTAALLLACAAPVEPPLGSVDNPVRTDGKQGEVAYLGRLRCPSGGAPHFHFVRRGPRGPWGTEVDEFSLRCVTDNLEWQIYVDRHHPGFIEANAIPGLNFEEATGSGVTILDSQ